MASAMEDDTSTNPAGVTPPRLYGIVGPYIQKQLPRDIHPAYKALRDHGEVVTISPQLRSTEETTLPSLAEQDQGIKIDQFSGNKDDVNDEDGLPLYVVSRGRCHFMADSVKGRIVQRRCE